MGKITKLVVAVFMFVLCCMLSNTFAETSSNELQEGRYILTMMNGRAIINNRVPALILDSYRGVVWTCQNLQDEKPLWVRTDLGQNGNRVMDKKKYVARMLEWQDANLRMPGVVLDVEDGIVWNCPNIVDGKATWIQKDLKSDSPEEESKNEAKE